MRAATTIKGKLEKVKIDLELIKVVCVPGLKDRHWQRMSEIVTTSMHIIYRKFKLNSVM